MSLLLKPLESALNLAIAQDEEVHQRLAAFAGRSIVIELSDLQQKFRVVFTEQRLKLSEQDDQDADLLIQGKSLALLQLGRNPDDLFSADITMHGNVQFAKQLRDALEIFEFDWERQLARVTGDTLAYPIAEGLRQGFQWLKQNHQTLQMNLAEYVKEELELLPDQSQIDPYLRDIDKLRSDCDRLEARIQRLETK